VTRKTDEIDAMEKQIAESLVDQVRDDLLRAAGKEPDPIPIPTANSIGCNWNGSWRICAKCWPSLSGQLTGGRN
jgi:hypothetical protein